MANIKVEVAAGVTDDMTEEDRMELDKLMKQVTGIANSLGPDSSPEDFIEALECIGVIEMTELDSEDGSHSVLMKKTIH